MKKRLIALLTSVLLFSTVLAGCAGGAEKDTPSSKAPEDTGNTTTQPEETKKKDLSGKVVYWSMWLEEEPQGELMNKAKDMFTKDYPDCEVEIQYFGRSVRDTVIAAIQAGEQIDVFDFVNYPNDPSIFADISSILEEDAIGQPGVTFKDSLSPSGWLFEENEAKNAGMPAGIHGVPMSPWVLTFFYNKDIFKDAGAEVPTTWKEFLEVCEKIKAKGIAPVTNDDAYNTMVSHFLMSRIAGSKTLIEMSASPTAAGWTDGTLEKLIVELETMAKNGYFSKSMATNKFPAGQQEFAMGDAAMYFNASWFPGEVAETAGADFPWGQFAFPIYEGGKEEASSLGIGCNLMYVSTKAKNPEGGKEFLKYIVSKECQDLLSSKGFTPATKGSTWPKEVADQGPIADQMTELLPWSANWDSEFIKGAVDPTLTEVQNGTMSAADALKKILGEASKY